MQKRLIRRLNEYARRNRRAGIWSKTVRAMACVVIFCTTYALILPAITMEKNPCELEEHSHSESCYAKLTEYQINKLSCSYESLQVHEHTDECRDEENNLICGLADFLVHVHDASCFDEEGNFVCALEEIREHEHTEECYISEEEKHEHTEECYTEEPGELICGLDETEGHTHEEECFTRGELICTLSEAGGHAHGEGCSANELVCTLTVEPHNHGEGCYTQLVCELPEDESHSHSESCTGSVLSCDLTEQTHNHGEGCYETKLVCTVPEAEGHSHSDDCYEKLTVCELPEEEGHAHSEDCYEKLELLSCQWAQESAEEETGGDAAEGEGTEAEAAGDAAPKEPLCGKDEIKLHSHDEEACYEKWLDEEGNEQKRLICTQLVVLEHIHGESCFVAETHEAEDINELKCLLAEAHVHGEGCFDEGGDLTCTETENHTHGEMCYGTWELACGKQEHKHDIYCQNDETADLETEAEWKASFTDASLSGVWAEDVLEIAKTQLGYTESSRNYQVAADGETLMGYSRYGAWYGEPYADWNTLFAMFCLHHAGAAELPADADALKWRDALAQAGLYTEASEAAPAAGQLAFFGGEALRVGIVSAVDESGALSLICGDAEGSVRELTVTPEEIAGLVDLLPAQEELDLIHEHTEACYEQQLVCNITPHQHEENCYDPDGGLVCTEDTGAVHEHTEACYENVLICTAPETRAAEIYLCGLEEHSHGEECVDEAGSLICELEVHEHFILCKNPNAQLYCRLQEHSHEEACYDAEGTLICLETEHKHGDDCYDKLAALRVMLATFPTPEEAEAKLAEYEEAQDWDAYVAYRNKISDLAWPLYYYCQDLTEEELQQVDNYHRLTDLEWLWSAVPYAQPAKAPYYPMDNGDWVTSLPDGHEFKDYVHVNEPVPDKFTVDGLILGAKMTDGFYTSFTPVITSSLEGLTDEECIALTGYDWHTLDTAGLDNSYGANLLMPADNAAHSAVKADGKNFIVYYNVGTYNNTQVDLLIQIENYKSFVDADGVVNDGILGFYSNGYIGITVCGVEWVKLRYNFIAHGNIAAAIEAAEAGNSLSGLRMDVRGSTSFYDVDYSQAVHMYGSDDWTNIVKGIYVTNVPSDDPENDPEEPDLDYVNTLGNSAKRDYFSNWRVNDCVLKIGKVDHEYASWTGPVIYSSHPYDAANESWTADSKHAFTETFAHTWFYMNFSFGKGRNAEGGIRHYGEPVSRGSVTVTKEVTGVNVDPEKEFEFRITFYKQNSSGAYVADSSLNGTYGGVYLSGGVGSFKLKDGQSITVSNIPIRQNGRYRVEEIQPDGYIVETSMTSQLKGGEAVTNGPFTVNYYEDELKADALMAQQHTVLFENYGGAVLPDTGAAGTTQYTAGGLLLMAAASLLYIHKAKRRREDKASF